MNVRVVSKSDWPYPAQNSDVNFPSDAIKARMRYWPSSPMSVPSWRRPVEIATTTLTPRATRNELRTGWLVMNTTELRTALFQTR
jgi:hypothetical protein